LTPPLHLLAVQQFQPPVDAQGTRGVIEGLNRRFPRQPLGGTWRQRAFARQRPVTVLRGKKSRRSSDSGNAASGSPPAPPANAPRPSSSVFPDTPDPNRSRDSARPVPPSRSLPMLPAPPATWELPRVSSARPASPNPGTYGP